MSDSPDTPPREQSSLPSPLIQHLLGPPGRRRTPEVGRVPPDEPGASSRPYSFDPPRDTRPGQQASSSRLESPSSWPERRERYLPDPHLSGSSIPHGATHRPLLGPSSRPPYPLAMPYAWSSLPPPNAIPFPDRPHAEPGPSSIRDRGATYRPGEPGSSRQGYAPESSIGASARWQADITDRGEGSSRVERRPKRRLDDLLVEPSHELGEPSSSRSVHQQPNIPPLGGQRLRPIHEGWPAEREQLQIPLPPIAPTEGFSHQPPGNNLTPTGPLANLSLRSFTPPVSHPASPRLHRPLPRRIAAHAASAIEADVQESIYRPRAVSPIELDAAEGWAHPMRLGTEAELAAFLEHERSESESDGEGEPSRKREKGRKTSIACNRCRKRKIGCDGVKPHPCSSCLSKRWECVYVEKQRRRGPGKAPRGAKKSKGGMPERPDSSHSMSASSSAHRSLHGTPENLHYTFSTPGSSLAGPSAPLPPLGPSAASSSTPAHYQFINEQPGLNTARRAGRRRPGSRGSTPGSLEAGIGRAGGSTSQAHAGYRIPSSASPPRVHTAPGSPPVMAPTGDFTYTFDSTVGRSGNLLRRSAPIYADVSRVDNGTAALEQAPGSAPARRYAEASGTLLSVDTRRARYDDESSDGGELPPTTASSMSPS